MPDVMNDEFLMQRDVDPVTGLALMAAAYVIVPAILWAVSSWLSKRKRA